MRSEASPAELEGFAAGLAHALLLLRRDGRADPRLEREVAAARRELEAGHGLEAQRILQRVDEALAARRGESELTEFPRGLVGYTARGPRGDPPDPEEDPLANRFRLVLRLLELAQPSDQERAGVLEALGRAEHLLAEGNRREAKRCIDAAHRIVESAADRAGSRIKGAERSPPR